MIKGREGSHVRRSSYFSLKRFIIVGSKVSVVVLHTSWITSEEDAIYDNASSIVETPRGTTLLYSNTALSRRLL